MYFGVFDLFKIGIGLLSLYMVGFMKVGKVFMDCVIVDGFDIVWIEIEFYGFFVLIGLGYGIDIVVLLGLEGNDFVKFNLDIVFDCFVWIWQENMFKLVNDWEILFVEKQDLDFCGDI